MDRRGLLYATICIACIVGTITIMYLDIKMEEEHQVRMQKILADWDKEITKLNQHLDALDAKLIQTKASLDEIEAHMKTPGYKELMLNRHIYAARWYRGF